MNHDELNEKLSVKLEEELRDMKSDIKEIKKIVKVLDNSKSQFFLEGLDPHEIKDTIETTKTLKKVVGASVISMVGLWLKHIFF